MPQEHPVLGVAGLQIMAITENRRFVADHHNLFAGVLGDLLACEIIHALRNVLIGFAPTRLVQVGDQFPIAVLPQRAFAMADTLAAELVAGLNHSLIGGEHERGFASGLAHGIQRVKNRVGGLARAVQGRRIHRGNRIGLRAIGQIGGGGLCHTPAKIGEMEVGQPLIEQMVRVVDLAVANEVDGGCAHEPPFFLFLRASCDVRRRT